MLYFKNTELASKYHISLPTVRNWIEAARKGNLELTLHNQNGKLRIANTASNILAIERLTEDRKKYRPRKALKLLAPSKEFYALYNQAQINDIVTNLELRREIPRQYNYFDGGAKSWDDYIQRMDRENAPSNLTMTRKLLASNQGYIDDLLSRYKKVNVVDVGVGNALPVKEYLAHLLQQGKLGRYIAIDISPSMLDIARDNIREWFGDKITFEGHQVDISRQRFADIIGDDYIKSGSQDTGNLILFLGGTIQNFRKRSAPLQVINDSMGANDLLVHTQKLDSVASRRHFDFNAQPGEQTLPPIHRLVVELLTITPSLYELELGYDKVSRERYERIRLKVAISIKFEFPDGEHVVNLEKGEAILVWRASQDTALSVIHEFDQNDFYMLHSSQTGDQEYILTVSRVQRTGMIS